MSVTTYIKQEHIEHLYPSQKTSLCIQSCLICCTLNLNYFTPCYCISVRDCVRDANTNAIIDNCSLCCCMLCDKYSIKNNNHSNIIIPEIQNISRTTSVQHKKSFLKLFKNK